MPDGAEKARTWVWVKPNGAILFSCFFKLFTSFEEFSKAT
jgi:hypothetical protein